MTHVSSGYVRGRVQLYRVADGAWTATSKVVNNSILYEWSAILAQLLLPGDARYRISGMYFEFENVENPGDTVTPPAFDRTRTLAYYNNLSSSASRDYLRVPLTSFLLNSSGAGHTNDLLTIFATSSGSVGVHGKPFSHVDNSVIYGASLVAIPDVGDRTKDLLFSSMYLPTNEQQAKLASSQVGLKWDLTLG
jgi:hypothetical protein